MRSRLLAVAAALVLALGGLVLLVSPASAHCGNHQHPDLYNGGGIFFQEPSTVLKEAPHANCDPVSAGFPGDGIDVHCAVINDEEDRVYLFARSGFPGVSGWAREGAFRVPNPVVVRGCGDQRDIVVSG
jgi:hypothetical protein